MLEQETVGQEATIILGKNIGIGWHREEIREQKYHLSDHSRINLLAAGIDYTRGRTDKIIFSTGKTAGDDLPSEAQLMKDRLQQIWPSIPDEDIILEENSTQTRENASEVRQVLSAHPEIESASLLTVYFHMRRARGLFRKAGIQTTAKKSDEVLGQYFPKLMARYRRGNILERIKETLGTPVQLYVSPLAKRVEGYVRKSRS